MPAPVRRSGAATSLWAASALLVLLLPACTAAAAAAAPASAPRYATVNSSFEFGAGNTYWWNEVTGESTTKDPLAEAAGFVSASGTRFWVDPTTGESTWTQPEVYAWSESADPAHGGRTYFYNSVTGESTWERPAPLSWVAAEKGWWSNNVTSATSTTEPEAFGHLSADGKRYWVVAGEASWTAPAEFAWEAHSSAEHGGRAYFHNSVTGGTTWDRPAALGWTRRSYNRTQWVNLVTGEASAETPKPLVPTAPKGKLPKEAAWEKRTEAGKEVYVNSVTKEKSPDLPADSNLAWVQSHIEL